MSCIVLLFHSVDDRGLLSIKGLGNIRPEDFGKALKFLKKDFDIVSVKDCVEALSVRKRKERLLTVTFDDGPRSYALNALPLMQSLGIPSTCFLITDCVGEKSVYWRYLYNYCIQAGFGRQLSDVVGATYGASVSAENLVSFTRGNFKIGNNNSIINSIFKTIIPEGEYRDKERDLFLSDEDIEELKANPLVTFGIHTRTHPVMRHLEDTEIEGEMKGSMEFHANRITAESPFFSVPFGRLYKDYDERVILAARKMSLKAVFSAYGGDNSFRQPLYNIRRIPVNEGMLKDGPAGFVKKLELLCYVPEYAEAEKRLYNFMKGRTRSSQDEGKGKPEGVV